MGDKVLSRGNNKLKQIAINSFGQNWQNPEYEIMFRLYEDKWIHGSKMCFPRLAQVNTITIKYLAFSGYILVKYYRPFGSLSAPQRNNCYLTTKVFFVHYHEQQKQKRTNLTELSVFGIYENAHLCEVLFLLLTNLLSFSQNSILSPLAFLV